jgi:Na+/H+ antiporter NhaD/arsenite permease-like protein
MSFTNWLTLFIVVVILAGIAIGRFPILRMNRATIALVGATILIATGAMSLPQAYAALDMNTLVLLFAMMIINANLRLAGFFQLVATQVVRVARSPRLLLALIIIAAGFLSALFLNDTMVLMLTPLVVEITLTLRRNPIPYLLALATAANVGSVATITGNPQNMLIGMASGISYLTFLGYLLPVALVGMGIIWVVLVLLYRAEFTAVSLPPPSLPPPRLYRPLLRKSLLATGLMLVAFFVGVPIPLAALVAASILLVTRRLKPERVFRDIDWTLLVFFAGLFMVTGALETSGLSERLFAIVQPVAERGIGLLTAVALILSNTISNVPAVMLFRPLVPHFAEPQTTWLVLAMSTTLAGNLTLLGSVANLIVAESARAKGVKLTFSEYLWAGLPITLLSLIWGVLWLSIIL